LRKAFDGLLPDHILNRMKEPFASEAGSAKLTEGFYFLSRTGQNLSLVEGR